MYNTRENNMLSKTSRNEITCSFLHIMLLQPKKFILLPAFTVVNTHGAPPCSAGGTNF